MSRTMISALAAASISLAFGGCGDDNGLYPVYGKVTYKGEPASGASVSLHRKGGDAPNAVIPRGDVRADGSFRIESGDLGRGALPGSYSVLVEWRQGPLRTHRLDATRAAAKAAARENKPILLADDRLRGHYFDPTHPRLDAEIKAETNNLPPFDLTD